MSERPTPEKQSILEAMLDSLRHRGPDGSGLVLEAGGRVLLGHRRLAIVELSEAGRQPMESSCGRYVLTFNGEVYNFRRLRETLRQEGYRERFRGQSDTEVLLAAITHWGLPAALGRVIGMFSLALWDRGQGKLWLARDRIGKKPLYYGRCGGDFVFASELRAFRRHPEFSPAINPAGLTLFLRFGYVPSPLSILSGVFKLQPGHLYCPGSAPQRFWSHAEFVGTARPIPAARARTDLLGLLEDSVRLRLISDVPLGVLLSGGVDSSLIAALAQRESSHRVKTFALGFEDDPLDETAEAAEVADYLGTQHTQVRHSPEAALALLRRLPEMYDEPFCDPSQLPTYLVCLTAREQVKVVLSGDGGDELFCGYDRYRLCSRQWAATAWFPHWLRRRGARLLELVPPQWWHRLTGLRAERDLPDRVHGLVELLRCPRLLDNYYRLAGLWNRPELALLDPAYSAEFEARLSGPTLADRIENLMFFDAETLLPDGILTKVDRASMAVGLEVRSPLLDHRVVEFAWQLPNDLKYAGGSLKWILKSLLYELVPRPLVDRPKRGFNVPLGRWLRGPFRDWADQLLDPVALKAEGFFRPEAVAKCWHEFLHQGRAWHQRLWAVMVFQLWWSDFRASRSSVGART